VSTLSQDSPWRPVGRADGLAPGAIVDAVSADPADDEPEIVIWRTASGQLCAMDARCPHQYSHLAAEGQVDGEEIVCCSHWWRFDIHGNASWLGRNGTRDEKAPTVVYPVREVNGTIEIRTG